MPRSIRDETGVSLTGTFLALSALFCGPAHRCLAIMDRLQYRFDEAGMSWSGVVHFRDTCTSRPNSRESGARSKHAVIACIDQVDVMLLAMDATTDSPNTSTRALLTIALFGDTETSPTHRRRRVE